ncbi:prepilin-type cleavage/methylation domain-containing protein [Lysobacteraceae bacterium NML91-0213]|nr:prepilin-type cleavage/methylation domain-containing protein [Xanthomonadaceae bacterium NML91-0213]
MKKMQKGFTLIELMIVVAIIAILAAIALPAYQDYVARSQVSEGMSLSAGAKTAVAEYYANHGAYPANNAAAGVSPAGSITGKYVSGTTIANGVITVAYAKTATSAKVRGGSLALSPTDRGGSIEWACAAGAGMEAKYLPSSCR